MEANEVVITVECGDIAKVFGQYDSNIKKIEKEFGVRIVDRGEGIKVVGARGNAENAAEVLMHLKTAAEKNEEITVQSLQYVIDAVKENAAEAKDIDKLHDDLICLTVNGRPLSPKTLGQKNYIDMIRKNTIVFGVGPAGTGKTFLAVAMAVSALKAKEISRIVLTRPAVEAGEKLGFLPGDLQSKIDPYLRPLYDALGEMLGGESFARFLEKGIIEIAPLAYMRGRTLDDAFIILDEAQNTTPEQMKMFLTRLGNNSKAIVTGDVTQIDLPFIKKSGLVEAMEILQDIEGLSIFKFSHKDVVRHPLVQKIILAYEKHIKDNPPKETTKQSFRRRQP